MAKLPTIAGSVPEVGRASVEAPAAVPANAGEFLGQLVEALHPTAPLGVAAPGAAIPVQANSGASSAAKAFRDSPVPGVNEAQPAAASSTDTAPARSTPLLPVAVPLLPTCVLRTGSVSERGNAAPKPDKAQEKSQPDTPAPVATTVMMLPTIAPPPQAGVQMADGSKPDAARGTRAAPSTLAATMAVPASAMLARSATDGSMPAQPLKKTSAAGPVDAAHRAGFDPMAMAPTVQNLPSRDTGTPARPASSPVPPGAAPSSDSPGAQLGAALHALMTAPDGTRQISLQLHPAELGQVAVQIIQPKDGPAAVQITAERPETMQLLMHDQPQLQRILDQVGIPAAGRTVSYGLAPSVSQPAGAGIADSGMGGGRREGGRRRRTGPAAEFAIAAVAPGGIAWQRTGIDITA